MKLLDKVALITGGAKRLGREIALALAEEGCDIVIHYRSSRDEAEALAREIRSMDRQAWTVCGDFSNAYEPDVTMRTAWELAGWIDILVNNASEFSHESMEDIPPERIEELWRINTLAPMMLSRTMYKLANSSNMLPPNYCGRIINILDRTICKAPDGSIPYWMTKKALADFTIASALQQAPRFTVNGVAPGPVLAPENIELMEAAGPLPLAIRPSATDIATAVLYLAQAISVTGQIIYVDSGQHML